MNEKFCSVTLVTKACALLEALLVPFTDMHMDHIGGLLVDGMRDRLRPDLRIHVAAAEVEFWASPR